MPRLFRKSVRRSVLSTPQYLKIQLANRILLPAIPREVRDTGMDRFRERTGRRRLIGRLPACSFPILFTPDDAEEFVWEVRGRGHQQNRAVAAGDVAGQPPTGINFGEFSF